MFGHLIKCWVNGVHPVMGAYVRLTLIFFFFFFKENFQCMEKLEVNEVGQNDFISLKFRVQ